MTTNTDPVRALAWAKLEREWAIDGMPADKIRLARAAFDAGAALASAPPSAPMGVEGFDKRFAEMLLGILNDVQDELGFTDEEKLCANGSAEIVSAIRELKERAASAPPSAPAPAAGDAVALDDATVDRYLRAIHLHLGGLTDAEVRKEKRAGVYEANAVRAGLTAAIAQDRASQAAAPSAPVGVEWPIIVEGLRLADRFFDGDDRYWKPASTVRAAYLAALAAQQQGGA